jgi:3-hydroxyisobutyrate dehydrogenase-like beta-hydroxyacid dehydrogenase
MRTIGIIGSGDMGSGVAAALIGAGFRVVTDLSDRSEHSRMLAAQAGTLDLGSLDAVLEAADLVLSIVPPAQASAVAERVAERLARRSEADGAAGCTYADCNAVSPARVIDLLRLPAASGATVLDVGIIGSPPARAGRRGTRFYVAGQARAQLLEMTVAGITFIDMGPQLGRASAIKMAYASLNKGVDALLTTVALSAMRLGVHEELFAELDASQTQLLARMRRSIPFLAAAAQRYVPEMHEIAATFSAAGTTPAFHEGAAWLYDVLAHSKFATETRAGLPDERSLEVALEAFAEVLDDE